MTGRPSARTIEPPAFAVGPVAGGAAPVSEVIDLNSARQTRQARRSAVADTGWACPECALSAGPFAAAEAAMLAALHDQVLRHSPRTALPFGRNVLGDLLGGVLES